MGVADCAGSLTRGQLLGWVQGRVEAGIDAVIAMLAVDAAHAHPEMAPGLPWLLIAAGVAGMIVSAIMMNQMNGHGISLSLSKSTYLR